MLTLLHWTTEIDQTMAIFITGGHFLYVCSGTELFPLDIQINQDLARWASQPCCLLLPQIRDVEMVGTPSLPTVEAQLAPSLNTVGLGCQALAGQPEKDIVMHYIAQSYFAFNLINLFFGAGD